MQTLTLLGIGAESELGKVIVGILNGLEGICEIPIVIMLLHAGILISLLSEPDCILTLLEKLVN